MSVKQPSSILVSNLLVTLSVRSIDLAICHREPPNIFRHRRVCPNHPLERDPERGDVLNGVEQFRLSQLGSALFFWRVICPRLLQFVGGVLRPPSVGKGGHVRLHPLSLCCSEWSRTFNKPWTLEPTLTPNTTKMIQSEPNAGFTECTNVTDVLIFSKRRASLRISWRLCRHIKKKKKLISLLRTSGCWRSTVVKAGFGSWTQVGLTIVVCILHQQVRALEKNKVQGYQSVIFDGLSFSQLATGSRVPNMLFTDVQQDNRASRKWHEFTRQKKRRDEARNCVNNEKDESEKCESQHPSRRPWTRQFLYTHCMTDPLLKSYHHKKNDNGHACHSASIQF